MKKVAYMVDGVIKLTTYTQDVDINSPHVVVDREILEPIESWYIENGQIKIDKEKLLKINRENMKRLKPMDFDLILDKFNLYDDVQALIATDRELYIAYNRATYFSRVDPFVEKARIALNLSNEQIDEMWTS